MNYGEILQAVRDYSDRTDLDSVLPSFTRVVESRMNRALRIGSMSVRTQALTLDGEEYFGLPSLFGGIRDVEIKDKDATKGSTAIYVSPEQMNNKTTNDGCYYYTLVANQIQIYPPADDKVMELIYYQRLKGLVKDEDYNWMSERYPDVYIFGLMIEVEAYVKNQEGAALWEQRYKSAVAEIDQEDAIDRWSGTSMTIKTG